MSGPREGGWTAKPLAPRALLYLGLLAVPQALIYVKLAYLLIAGESKKTPIWIEAFQAVALVAVSSLILGNELRIRRRTKEDAARCERPEGLEEFAVEITVRANGSPLGGDRGVVYFDRGLLGFVGVRTSFLLAEEDFARPKGPVLFEWDRLFLPLPLDVEPKGAAVVIRPLFGQGRAYRRALRRFLRAREGTDADRQWPPLVPWGKEKSTVEEGPMEAPSLSEAEAAELLERAEIALRLGHVVESQRLQDEALGTTRHNRA